MVTGEMHGAHDIIHSGALGDDGGPAVDHRIEDGPSLLIGGMVRKEDCPCEIPAQFVENDRGKLYGHISLPLLWVPGHLVHYMRPGTL
jgi:hypothetical protein